MKRFLFIALCVAAIIPMSWNIYYLSRDMILGDGSAVHVFPKPYHRILRVGADGTLPGRDYENRLAADFAQIYFPAQDVSRISENYQTGYLDPWSRPSRYSSFQHRLCALTICKLGYGYASVLHIAIQLIVFAAALIYTYTKLGLKSHLPAGLLFAGICLFLTPVGLSWFERGQFTLYVGASCLFLTMGLIKRSYTHTALAGFFGHIKWTSFPYLFIIMCVFLLSSRSFSELKKNLVFATVFSAPIVLLLLIFPVDSYYFVAGLLDQEANAKPLGPLSLSRLLPRELVKLLPISVIGVGYIYLRLNSNNFNWNLTPFFAGSFILSLTYPTLAFNYSLPAALGFIPLLLCWAQQSAGAEKIRMTLPYGYMVFLFLASISFYRPWFFRKSLADEYALFSIVFMLIGIAFLFQSRAMRKKAPGWVA